MELQWQGKEWNDTPVSITLRGPNDREMTVRGDQFGRFFTSLAVWK
jgi:hypothetical protein